MKNRSAFSKTFCTLSLVLAALSASGCVYLRLLQLKNQLADFDRHFELRTNDGLEIHCTDPVLLDEDLRWLGADPEAIQKTLDGETWHMRWVKDAPPGPKETEIHDVDLFADLRDHQLTALRIPEHYFEAFPKDLLINLLRSTGKAHIDKQTRQAQVDTAAAETASGVSTPDIASVEKLLGAPTERKIEPLALRFKYRYRARTPSGSDKTIEVNFYFDSKTRLLRRLLAKLPKGSLNFAFPTPLLSKP